MRIAIRRLWRFAADAPPTPASTLILLAWGLAVFLPLVEWFFDLIGFGLPWRWFV